MIERFPTTGTTGPAKTVLWSRDGMVAMAGLWAPIIEPSDVAVSMEAPRTVWGEIVCLEAPAINGTKVFHHQIDKIDAVADLIDEVGATILFLSAVTARKIIREAHPHHTTIRRVILLTKGGISENLRLDVKDWTGGAKVSVEYGLSECGPVTLSNDEPWREGFVGRPIAGVEVRIDDGEILVKTPALADGYEDGPLNLTADGWLRTGDRGHIENGAVWLTGRVG
jgi:acyl-CoA synthetase (AMP-forming)/AMP-acid ligase II